MSERIADQISIEREARRCAVFKIDLTGRFVFIDENTEKLLKLQIDSIFGQNIEGFLDQDSYKIIQNIMTESRLYETFYESAELIFIDSAKKNNPRSAIISLNFIGGNPANYQVVVAPEKKVKRKRAVSKSKDNEFSLDSELVEFLAEQRGELDWHEVASLIMNDDDIIQIAFYKYAKEKLKPLAFETDPLFQKKGIDLEDYGENHLKSAKYNMPYISEGEGKLDGLTDACFPLVCKNDSWALLRIVVKGDFIKMADKLKKYADFIGNAFYGYSK